MLTVGTYAIARDLKGFRSDTLRVKVTRIDGNNVFIRTADLVDAGTPLVLDASQVTPEIVTETVWRHKDGLVAFA